MIVTFISQCEKKALKRTRRILDSFANRIGDNVWQTAITEAGLDMVRQLLRRTATKSTAVSCHRNRTSHTTELVWIVGNKRKFNELGIVPVNQTKRNIMKSEWENAWENLTTIQCVSVLASLFHDLGKSSKLFQEKLTAGEAIADPYRHEWVSLKLFLHLIQDCKNDDEVLIRLEKIDDFLAQMPCPTPLFEPQTYKNVCFGEDFPLTKWIAWLIVTHHRLPPLSKPEYNAKNMNELRQTVQYFKLSSSEFYGQLKAIEGWVFHQEDNIQKVQKNWSFDKLVWNSPAWQKKVKRYASKMRNDAVFKKMMALYSNHGTMDNPFLLNLSRLVLMVGDHNYSSLAPDSQKRVSGSPDWEKCLAANTSFVKGKNSQINQALDEHLIGVAQYAASFARALPIIQSALPSLKHHDSLAKNTDHARFVWQNMVFKKCRDQAEVSKIHGFFAVNMASTGCGKTIANARMAYALADTQKGSRFTIALGLRTLTLQTGYSLRKDLGLNESQLAVLVGGQANTQLFNLNHKKSFSSGSDSAQGLVGEYVDTQIDLGDYDALNLGGLTSSDKAQKLLYSPVVTCTIDHLIQASEHQRGGHYIVPTLRLLSSDLILDEPDDFSESDLPALTRLVHLAGIYGSRVILSSATLQADQVLGLFIAYLEGRKIYNQQFNLPSPHTPCLWVDEKNTVVEVCQSKEEYAKVHEQFLQKRQDFLAQQSVRRIGEVLDLNVEVQEDEESPDLPPDEKTELYIPLAKKLVEYAQEYHHRHHVSYEDKTISIGLIRMANINPLVRTALAMLEQGQCVSEDTHIHLCVYHSRQALILRNRLETSLDDILNRKNSRHPAEHPVLKALIKTYPRVKHHVFIVLASPVCEVGRDHDYDWALLEPSSMRSLIQLAGRIGRHRPDNIPNEPNIGIWQKNIFAMKKKKYAYRFPGYEGKDFPLNTHDIKELIREEELRCINALPRIIKPQKLEPTTKLADLEHEVLASLMNNAGINLVNAYWREGCFNRQHTHLIRLSPFRTSQAETEYVIHPKAGELVVHYADQLQEQGVEQAGTVMHKIEPFEWKVDIHSPITPWLTFSLEEEIAAIRQKLGIAELTALLKFACITVPESQDDSYFHEYFGCWKRE